MTPPWIFALLISILLAPAFLPIAPNANANTLAVFTTGAPRLKTPTGEELIDCKVGELCVISVAVINQLDPSSFVVIIEVRDEKDISQFIQFQTGDIEQEQVIDAGVSWSPESAGGYELRTFLISDFDSARVLTGVKTNFVVVSPSG